MHSSALQAIFFIHLTARAESTYLFLTTDILFMSRNLGLRDFCCPDGGENRIITSLSSHYDQDLTGLFLNASEILCLTLYL
jgi:hypothetical protein